MKIREILSEYVAPDKPFITPNDLRSIGDVADSFWNNLGVNVAFGGHFIKRANERDIEKDDIQDLLTKQYHSNGEKILQLKASPGKKDPEGVMVDLSTDLNIPFAMHDHGRRGKDLMAQTVMKKKNFQTPDKKFFVK